MFRTILTAAVTLVLLPATLQAQGLIWRLPDDDNVWVRFEGTYRQTVARPDSTEGNLEMEWQRHITMKSVGREDADYRGETVPCRWVEIKIQTGGLKDGAINTGKVGERIYKVLIPENGVPGSLTDSEGIPVLWLPIVKGYRKTNESDLTPKEIKSGVLQVYPAVSLVRHYQEMEVGAEESLTVGANDVTVTPWKGVYEEESPTRRVVHESTLYRSDAMHFGLARWTVKITQEAKNETEARSEFKFATEINVEMTAREIGTDARTELVTDGN